MPKGNITRTEFAIYVLIAALSFALVFGVIIADYLQGKAKDDQDKRQPGKTNVALRTLGE